MAINPDQSRPAYLRPGNVGLVFLGGMLGVLAREMLMLAAPAAGAVPVAVLIANVLGALMLGLLLTSAKLLWPANDRRQSWRLVLGTGALGGFTTYSALAQAVLVLWGDGAVWLAFGYGIGTLLLGGIATWCGVLLGSALVSGHNRKRSERE